MRAVEVRLRRETVVEARALVRMLRRASEPSEDSIHVEGLLLLLLSCIQLRLLLRLLLRLELVRELVVLLHLRSLDHRGVVVHRRRRLTAPERFLLEVRLDRVEPDVLPAPLRLEGSERDAVAESARKLWSFARG